ncbi:hypothetical protein L7F22_030795 [Adiantum nelumboides]|nr:hypothetical protein [Adiantum nelumboides]
MGWGTRRWGCNWAEHERGHVCLDFWDIQCLGGRLCLHKELWLGSSKIKAIDLNGELWLEEGGWLQGAGYLPKKTWATLTPSSVLSMAIGRRAIEGPTINLGLMALVDGWCLWSLAEMFKVAIFNVAGWGQQVAGELKVLELALTQPSRLIELSLMLPSLRVPVAPAHVSIRSAIPPLCQQNRRVLWLNASLIHQSEPFCQHRVSLCSSTIGRAGDTASAWANEGDESTSASKGGSGGEGAPESDEEYNSNVRDDVQKKADKILKDAIDNFVQSDIEEASEKYDMEEQLFAEIDFAQINAFTDRPFAGNPAAVCYLPLKRTDDWLQLVAREFNLSETAFLMKRNTRKKRSPVFKKSAEEELAEEKAVIVDEFDLRWFTPKIEVDFCGHATLASAHLLFSSGIAGGDTIIFHTRSGVLKAKKISGYEKAKVPDKVEENSKDGDSEAPKTDDFEDLKTDDRCPIGVGVVELDFPMDSYTKCDDAEAEALSAALGGVKLLWAGKTTVGDYLAEVSCSKEVEQLQPQFSRMSNLSGRGVIVTAPAVKTSGSDFVSRFFAPKSGIMEDPVTGSAHCALGPFWAERLGKSSLKAYQASERGGHIEVRVDTNEGRVYLQGSAVLVMAGVLLNTLRA